VTGLLRHVSVSDLGALPETDAAFLRRLGGPTAIRVAGRDRSRTRVATTLLHGNEPSGTRAAHAWLRSGAVPAVDALLIVANVAAALEPPGFAWRTLPEHRDLNRCFLGPFDGGDGALAREILDAIEEAAPEAVIDLHNNSGHNPPYGVGPDPDPRSLELVSLFADRFVWSRLRLGALVEAVRSMPCVTVEAGRSGDPAADAVALGGLARFLERDTLFASESPLVQVLEMPMRARLRPGVRLAVGEAPAPDADLTLSSDLDRHNFERVEAGTAIGWCSATAAELVVFDDELGRDRTDDYLEASGGRLRTRRPIVPIMITTDPAIAAADCLFYAVRERAPAD
jgi:Succinylglutamate desuccinylase / Aspartoacylase family